MIVAGGCSRVVRFVYIALAGELVALASLPFALFIVQEQCSIRGVGCIQI